MPIKLIKNIIVHLDKIIDSDGLSPKQNVFIRVYTIYTKPANFHKYKDDLNLFYYILLNFIDGHSFQPHFGC